MHIYKMVFSLRLLDEMLYDRTIASDGEEWRISQTYAHVFTDVFRQDSSILKNNLNPV